MRRFGIIVATSVLGVVFLVGDAAADGRHGPR